ncbi:Sigma-54 interaction domain-containing protein [Malonomonas rubra DSM 5091]|uniref:Sigma-54 interaction domain-containing protein n=1 Tax=Malonomonas rubra DSM 5091 TaxID=1122189 RepID=A0A1M6CJ01_MALRU|nr:sigma 54-interacting transcriptional regulator [Malonomonas rubra]SHI60841.1 Sigma-54 interaction domain-containing protein [Malonomonas rubra DSM 5091]
MSNCLSLTVEDRQFFQLVSQAAFSNPFSDERDELDRLLAGITGASKETLLLAAVESVRERVGHLQAGGRASLSLYRGEDRRCLELGLLFEQFHVYLSAFDELIQQQADAGDEPCAVPFSAELLTRLREYGFKAQEARHYLAFFYQLRRAFFFIDKLVGQSPSMRRLRCALWNNVFTHDIQRYEVSLWNRMEDFSTLLLGETGTGKGAAAAAIGRSGYIPFDEKRGRFAESFTRNYISINLSQFPESLIESELFGHKKGAFTGAVDQHHGVLARCVPHGAIFLDEIGDVSVPVQIKLLKVLQERTFSPVGSHELKTFRGRIIAATNRSLTELRRDGDFRDDFYYRLCSDVIEVPTLRQQMAEDEKSLDLLLEQLLLRILGRVEPGQVSDVGQTLRQGLPADYPWPGNVRELEQSLRRVLLNGHYAGDPAAAGREVNLHDMVDTGEFSAQELLTQYCCQLYRRFGTYEEVARRARLDRRTVKKYIQS